MTDKKKLRVALLCGGLSAEHEVSLQSAKNILDALDRDKFEPYIIGIDKSGRFLLEEGASFILNGDDPEKIALNPDGIQLAVLPGFKGFVYAETKAKIALDAVFPVLHGPFGEDGTVQGLLALLGLPFVGSAVLGSACGMDKDVSKRLLREAGLQSAAFLVFEKGGAIPEYGEAAGRLGRTLFVKPANMGSSVGVRKVNSEADWKEALHEAFKYDSKIIVEENIAGREIECAVLETSAEGGGLLASAPGEIKSSHEFYSYEAKYIDKDGALLEIPAKLPPPIAEEVKKLAIKTFKVLCARGLARVDFFVKDDGEIFVNEINTLPGFTKISMYPKLFMHEGISYTDLITCLIENALRAKQSFL